ncbi:dihydrofolate reductase family protein [Nocardia sp. CA-135953]|uniref:dihydrofolate reductase family protein n=1 Tax=Nocardia sp. CA-135953 TaxID=3239978 RepID=UPI003D956794
MTGGTTFHFVNEMPEAVLRQAFETADGQNVRLVDGPSAIRQFLRAGLVDEMHLAVGPHLLRRGRTAHPHQERLNIPRKRREARTPCRVRAS